MPLLKPVMSLKSLCTDAMASVLAYSFVSIAGGGLTGPVRRMVGGGGGSRTKKQGANKRNPKVEESILTSNPASQVKKVQDYMNRRIPKAKRGHLLHPVILLVTEILTKLPKGRSKKVDYSFSKTVQKLGFALSYTLDLLLSPDVTKLELTPFLHHVIKWVSTCKLNNRNPKETDEIDASKVENMLIAIFNEHSPKLQKLTTLQWPHLVSSEVIKLIGRHCRNLQHLTLACECDATTMNDVKEDPAFARRERELINSLGALYGRAPGDFSGASGSNRLQTLVLPRMDDEDGTLATHIADALCALREIRSITGAPMLVSLAILKNDRNAPQRLCLKHISDIDSFNRRPMPDMEYLKNLLPYVNSIELIVSQPITLCVTENFINSKSLKIAHPDFHTQVRSFKHLDTLDINLDFKIAWSLIFAISRGGVPIKNLTLRHPTFQVGHEHEGLPVKLPHLKSFTIIRSSFIEFTAFRNLIKGAPNLVTLSITLSDDRNYMVDEFRDELIMNVAPMLTNLENFTAECQYKHNLYNHMNCVLTMTAVDVLCASCPRLKFIGHLDVWDITDYELGLLHDRIRRNNWDLQVV